MKLSLLPVAGLMVAAGLLTLYAADEPLSTPYFPLKKDTRWQYKVAGSSLVVKVARFEKVGDVTCAVLEWSRDDQVLSSERIGVKADGVYNYSLGGLNPEAPFRILALPPKKGDSWKIETKAAGRPIRGKFTLAEAEVTVPAGKYTAITVTGDGFEFQDGNGNTMKVVIKFWFVEKVGLVKQIIQFGDRPEVGMELEKFEAP